MSNNFEVTRIRIDGKSLQQYVGKLVCVLGEVLKVDPNGRSFSLKASSGQVVNVHMPEPLSMKFIHLHPDDVELFDYDVNDKITSSDFLVTHFQKFRRMYLDQGSIFWVRYLLTLHEYYLDHVFSTVLELLAPHFKTCVHYCLKAIENTLIRIHKRYIEGQYESAKELIKDIYRFTQISPENKSQLIPFEPCFIKQNHKVVDLFGPCRRYDKSRNVKMYFVLFFYNEFYSSLCTLLKRYLTAPDLPDNYDDNYPDKQYWMPFDSWLDKKYESSRFEKYIAKFWGEKLPKMLLTPDIHNIFSRESHSHFCFLEGNEFSIEDLKYSQSSHLRHRFCDVHKYCRKRILHDKDCLEPYFCVAGNSCKVICDTLSRERRLKFINAHTDVWKKFEVVVQPCTRKKHRDVSTQVESYDSLVETYVVENIRDRDYRPPSPPWYLSPELKNTYNQYKRKEETVARLREKLEKKQIDCVKKKNTKQVRTFNTNVFRDRDYCVKLYKKAAKRMGFDLDSDGYTKLFKSQILENLSCIPIKEIKERLCEENKDSGSVSASSEVCGMKSIGVGYDGLLGCKVLTIRKFDNRKSEESASVNLDSNSEIGHSTLSAHSKIDYNQSNSICATNEGVRRKSFSNKEEQIYGIEVNGASLKENNQLQCISCDKQSDYSLNKTKTTEIQLSVYDESKKNEQINDSNHVPSSTTQCDDSAASNEVESCNQDCHQTKSECDEFKPELPIEITTNKAVLQSGENEDNYELKAKCHNHIIEDNFKCVDKIERQMPEREEFDNVKQSSAEGCSNRQGPSVGSSNVSSTRYSTSVSEKLDIIEKGIKEKQGLGYEEFLLLLEAGNQLVSNEPSEVKKKDGVKKKPSKNFHICAYCDKSESKSKFKKCAQCKAENFPQQRYYCSRECQTEDWKERHRDEHHRNRKL